jgi:Cytochrome c3/Cytochrome c554 and c-prime
MAGRRNVKWWIAWGVASAALAGLLIAGLTAPDAKATAWRVTLRSLFLPGATTHGHHQIETKCEACHETPWAGRESLQKACMGCHGAELKEARDAHPKSKFTDPRNAERAARLDAALCVTCHVEHRPAMTRPMGVTLPDDYCVLCHRDVGTDRPSHRAVAFADCTSAGCHNFHDNRALYEDFLVKHAREPALKDTRIAPERDFLKVIEELASYPVDRYPLKALTAKDADAGTKLSPDANATREWLETAHAKAGVNCSACHAPGKDAAGAVWTAKPGHDVCTNCHEAEVKGFLGGKHGMKLAAGLGPMTTADARIPMAKDAHAKTLGCTTCHAAHRFETRPASADACLGCHADRHSLAWKGSPHAKVWEDEKAGRLPEGSGVTCATCHLPRIEHRQDDVKRVLVQHNQNDTLRPSDKMARAACMQCHGLPFTLASLADRALVENNFRGPPAKEIDGFAWALEADRRAEESRKRAGLAKP